jgi:hypothetical protein
MAALGKHRDGKTRYCTFMPPVEVVVGVRLG